VKTTSKRKNWKLERWKVFNTNIKGVGCNRGELNLSGVAKYILKIKYNFDKLKFHFYLRSSDQFCLPPKRARGRKNIDIFVHPQPHGEAASPS